MDNSLYVFKPFHFQTLHKNSKLFEQPLGISDVVSCTDEYLISYEGPRCVNNESKLWKFYFDSHKWKTINCQGLPQKLTSTTILLTGSLIFILGIPPGDVIYNRVYYGNLDDENKEGGMQIKELDISGFIPEPTREYSQGVVLDGKNIFVVGGSAGNGYELDVFKLDLGTKKWAQLYSAIDEDNQDRRDSHQIIFYENRIYTFHSMKTDMVPYDFSQIHSFNLATNHWEIIQAQEDYNVPLPGYPIYRKCQNLFQCPYNKNLVYLCGGFNNYTPLFDMWRLDLNKARWEYLPKCIVPVVLLNTYSMTVSKTGRLCCYGAKVNENGDSNDITSTWITIPTLKDICWEATVFYFKDQMIASSNEELKKIGLPIKFYNRMIKAKAINTCSISEPSEPC